MPDHETPSVAEAQPRVTRDGGATAGSSNGVAGPATSTPITEVQTLLRHSSHYLMARVGVMALGFFSFPIFVRVFSVAEYGLLNLVVKVVAVVTVVSKMGLQNSVQRFYEEHAASSQIDAVRRFYSTIFFGALLTAAAAAALFAGAVYLSPGSVLSAAVRNLLLVGSLLVFIRGMHSIVTGFLRAERRTRAFNALDVIMKAGTIALVCLVLFTWQRSVRGFLVGTIVMEGAIVAGVALFLASRGLLRPARFDPAFFWAVLSFGLPLIGYELAGVILDSGDRILVQHYLGAEALGYYSAAYNISNYVVESLMTPVNLALFPLYMSVWVANGREQTQEFLSRALDYFLMVAVWLIGVVAVTARDAVIVLGSQKLQEAYHVLPYLVVGLMFYALHMFFSAGLLIYKKTATMAKLVTCAAVVNIVLNIVLIPRLGLNGAGIATLVSYALFTVLLASASSKLLPLRVRFRSLLVYGGAATVGGAVAWGFESKSALVNLVVKGVLSLGVYVAALWILEPRFRQLVEAVMPRGWVRPFGDASRHTDGFRGE